MRKTVLFCGPIDHPINSGRYIISGIEQLGYKVIGYDYRSHNSVEKDLLAIVEQDKPGFVFTLRGERLSPALIRKFKEMGCTTILLFTMAPMEDWMVPFAREHDYVLTNMESYVDFFRSRGVQNIRWFHQGFASEFFGIDRAEPKDVSTWYADVGMIGSMGSPLYTTRTRLVATLLRNDINIKWWGPMLSRKIRNLDFFMNGVHRAWAGKKVYMKEFADVVRHIKIFIGQDADLDYEKKYLYLSNRSLTVMGCGGFYLCRRSRAAETVYRIGKEIDVFDTDDELLEKIRYYLHNDRERQQIAHAGQSKVLENYTYKKQMEKIFHWVNESAVQKI
jgi:hypothetical protein